MNVPEDTLFMSSPKFEAIASVIEAQPTGAFIWGLPVDQGSNRCLDHENGIGDRVR